MHLAWTTVARPEEAAALAEGAVGGRLAACVQVEGPITSTYRWQGRVESATEYRVAFKTTDDRLEQLRQWVLEHHPYEVPQWIAVRASDVGVDYDRWLESSTAFS